MAKHTTPTCSIADCGRRSVALGYCMTHRARVLRYGDPQGDVPVRAQRRKQTTCSVEGCEQPFYCKEWCRNHHARWLRSGSPFGTAKKQSPQCSVEGCDTIATSRGFCLTHYKRVLRTGEPGLPLSARGEITYNAAHRRIYRSKGDAAAHQCQHCDRAAQDWAYDHTDPNAIRDNKGMSYSLDLARYMPLCRACHKRFDKRVTGASDTDVLETPRRTPRQRAQRMKAVYEPTPAEWQAMYDWCQRHYPDGWWATHDHLGFTPNNTGRRIPWGYCIGHG